MFADIHISCNAEQILFIFMCHIFVFCVCLLHAISSIITFFYVNIMKQTHGILCIYKWTCNMHSWYIFIFIINHNHMNLQSSLYLVISVKCHTCIHNVLSIYFAQYSNNITIHIFTCVKLHIDVQKI